MPQRKGKSVLGLSGKNKGQTKWEQPGRAGTRVISGHFDADVQLALRELLARVGRQNGKRVTLQEAMRDMIFDYFKKHGVPPPAGLKLE